MSTSKRTSPSDEAAATETPSSDTNHDSVSAPKKANLESSGNSSSGNFHSTSNWYSGQSISFSRVRSIEELDKKTLQIQNKKLWESLNEKREAVAELRDRITHLEGRQAKDDEILFVINRYWNQLDEDSLLLLSRFETDIEENLFPETDSFVKDLSTWEKDEVPNKLQERVHFSKRIIGKLLSAYDKLYMRQDRLTNLLRNIDTGLNVSGDLEASNKSQNTNEKLSPAEVQESLKEFNAALSDENIRLHKLITTIQERQHKQNLKTLELDDSLSQAKDKIGLLEGKLEEADYRCSQATTAYRKAQIRLQELSEENRIFNEEISQMKLSGGVVNPDDKTGSEQVSSMMQPNKTKYAEMATELEELRELAANRLTELEKLQRRHEEKVSECSRLSLQVKEIPDSVVMDSIPYKSLKTQFNILFNEVVSIRDQFDEYRASTSAIRASHIKQIEEMGVNEAAIQNQMKAELINQEEQYNQLKKEFEILEIDFKEAIEHNQQAGPIASEMRSLIATLQMQNKQLRSDVNRQKIKHKETIDELKMARRNSAIAQDELKKIRSAFKEATKNLTINESMKQDQTESLKVEKEDEEKVEIKTEEQVDKSNNDQESIKEGAKESLLPSSVIQLIQEQLNPMSCLRAMINDLIDFAQPFSLMSPPKSLESLSDNPWAIFLLEATQLRHSIGILMSKQNSLGKSAVLAREESSEAHDYVDYNSICNYSRDWAVLLLNLELANAEKKLKNLTEEWNLNQELLASARQQEEVLINEMEVTGQAFEDVQEQNARLLKSIREKDEANLKQMSDWMKTAQISRLLKEDKRLYDDQVRLMQTKIEALNRTIQKQEDKERLLYTNLSTLQRELSLRQQTLELLKRKSNDNQQAAEDLKITVQKYLGQLKEVQSVVQEKTSGHERATFRQQRVQEELTSIRRKYERLRKIEQSHNADEVLLAELHDYKEQLTCPTCKTNRKDAILTKCFHVFCLNCVKIRYETRNRKCPKCNATFGANDFHRIYLT